MNLKPPKLSYAEFLTGLSVKLLMGVLYGLVFLHFYNGDDTWKLNAWAVQETQVLLNDPLEFFTNAYTPLSAIAHSDNWKQALSIYIGDLEYALLVKTVAIFNLISHGNYYVNSILFNCITFFGHYWFFLLLDSLFPGRRRVSFVIAFFYLPALFWLSGLRADGLLFLFFSLFILSVYRKRALPAVIGIAGCFIMRPEFAAVLLPAAIAYFLMERFGWRAVIVLYVALIIVFFVSPLPGIIVMKQESFAALKGTRFSMPVLEATPESFIKAIPPAVNHSFLRPYPWETGNAMQVIYAVQQLLFIAVVIAAIIRRKQFVLPQCSHAMVVALVCFGVGIYVFVGIIVPFPGAIVRYKIIAELAIISMLAPPLFPLNKNLI